MRLPAGARIGQADRLHRAEAERLAAAPRHLLDRQAALEVGHLVELVALVLVGLEQRVEEALVPSRVDRRVEVVVALALAVAGERVEPLVIERVVDDTTGAIAS